MQSTKNKQSVVSGKKVSINEQIIVDYLNGENSFNENTKYIIKDNCVYAKSNATELFLFYKENNKIFYRFAENNKKHTKKILPLINDEFELYLMHREITYPKIRKDIFGKVDKYDMLHSMIYIYLEEKYYDILYKSGYDFLEILFKQIREFGAEDEMFGEDMTKNIKKWTKPKVHPDYDMASHWKDDVPYLDIPNEYLELQAENLKRAYKINYLIS